ncbi:MAG: hypothetical protein OXK82_03315 [Deltaproteobacteria bacterium]|nr:hypothetical protein [Deltaproteobacteria bacterium]
MVVGIEKFREYFAAHEDQYAIIGGAACDLLFNAAGLNFRATKDIDMVLCVEVVDAAFGTTFGAFLDAGGYQARERSDGTKEFYRFHLPTDQSFPFMIELFSRRPAGLDLPEDTVLTRIPVDDDVISLSAILLDDAYYAALQAAKKKVDGVTIIDEELLIPFKARAFLDLTERLDAGRNIHRDDIRKHRNDVFRLVQLLPQDASIKVPNPIRQDLRSFVNRVQADESLDPHALGVLFSRDEAVDLLRSAYGLV